MKNGRYSGMKVSFKMGKDMEKVNYANGLTYEGEFQNGEKHGHGKLTYCNGSTYEGEWQNGEKHGHGIFTYSDSSIYEGEWQDRSFIV